MNDAEVQVIPPLGLLIGDSRRAEGSGGEFDHIYPATGKPTVTLPLAGPSDVVAAVEAARTALPAWRGTTAAQRRDLMLRFADLLRDHQEDIARLSVVENGMPIAVARDFPIVAADAFTYNAGWADKVGGEVVTTWPAPALDYAVDEPYGVAGIIIPWNSPVMALGLTLAPALATGNTVVLKPSRLASFTALRFGELLLEAGFPPGVVNVLPGGPEAGAALARHPGVDKLHFMGSSWVARQVLGAAAENLTPVSLELGGKSANIVFADADLQAAAALAATAIVYLSGQACVIGTRVLVEEGVHDDFIEATATAADAAVVGDPTLEATTMGPVINDGACDRILGIVDQARRSGRVRLVTGGKRLAGDLADGYYISPTIFAEVDNDHELAQREIFGPVLSILRFKTEEEAIRIANDHRYGLAGYVQTTDLRRAHRVAAALEVGSAWINGYPGVSVSAPFGGTKHSGYGRLGGAAGIREFSRPKNVWQAL